MNARAETRDDRMRPPRHPVVTPRPRYFTLLIGKITAAPISAATAQIVNQTV